MIVLKNYIHCSADEHSQILRIRNLPYIREHAHSTEEITYDEHMRWVESLKTSASKLYFAVLSDNRVGGGVHLLQSDQKEPTWGIFFDPSASVWIISSVSIFFIDYCFQTFHPDLIRSFIHADNHSAVAFNKQLGFRRLHETDKSDDFTEMTIDAAQWEAQKETKILKKIIQYADQYPVTFGEPTL